MAWGDFLSVTALWNGLGGFSASSWNGLWGFSVSLFLCEFLCLSRLRGVACGDFLSFSLWEFLSLSLWDFLSRLRGMGCGDFVFVFVGFSVSLSLWDFLSVTASWNGLWGFSMALKRALARFSFCPACIVCIKTVLAGSQHDRISLPRAAFG